MKLLFVAENVFPFRDANGNCVWNLVKELHRCGHEVSILSTAFRPDELSQTEIEGISCFWHHTPWKYPLATTKRELTSHPLASAKRFAKKVGYRTFISKRDKETIVKKKEIPFWKTAIRETLKNHSFDRTIICFYPIEPILAYCDLKEEGGKIPPFCLYQLDAYIDNAGYSRDGRDKRVALVQRSFAQAAEIFTTPLLENQLKQVLPEKQGHISALEFPLLVEHPRCGSLKEKQESDKICGVFAGMLYPDIRRPDNVLKLLNACGLGNLKLQFYVSSSLAPAQIEAWKTMSPQIEVEFCAAIPFEKMVQVMNQADFLINIGNQAANQLPSKIIDYISTGKPILNVIQIENCPSLHYLNRYPLALNISVFQDIQTSAELCRDFIQKNAGRPPLPFGQVSKLFPELRPNAVAGLMMKRMCG